MTYGERTCQVRGPSSGESCALCTTDGGCDSGPVKFRDLAVGCAGGGGCGRRSRCFKRPPARWLRRRSVVARRSGLKALRVAFFFLRLYFSSPPARPAREGQDATRQTNAVLRHPSPRQSDCNFANSREELLRAVSQKSRPAESGYVHLSQESHSVIQNHLFSERREKSLGRVQLACDFL